MAIRVTRLSASPKSAQHSALCSRRLIPSIRWAQEEKCGGRKEIEIEREFMFPPNRQQVTRWTLKKEDEEERKEKRAAWPQQLFGSLKASETKVPLVWMLARGASRACRGAGLNLASLCSAGISSLWNSEMDGNEQHCCSPCVGKPFSPSLSFTSLSS